MGDIHVVDEVESRMVQETGKYPMDPNGDTTWRLKPPDPEAWKLEKPETSWDPNHHHFQIPAR